MQKMRLVVVGAAGRMGQMLVKAITASEGAMLGAAPGARWLARAGS